MSTTTEALHLIETLQKHGIKKEATTELIGFVEKQRGDLATKQGLEALRQANKQDLQAATEPLKRDINWIKWIGGVGFTALLTVMIYLHSDSKAEMKELKAEMENRLNRIEQRNTERHKEIKQLLQREQR